MTEHKDPIRTARGPQGWSAAALLVVLLASTVLLTFETLRSAPPVRSPVAEHPIDVDMLAARDASGRRFSVPLALAEHAPGVVVVLDSERTPRLAPLFLRHLGGAVRVESAVLPDLRTAVDVLPPDGVTRHDGADLSGPWSLFTAPGHVATVLAAADASGMLLLDARLVRAWDTGQEGPAPTGQGGTRGAADTPRTVARDSAVDTGVLLLVTFLGGLLLPRHRALRAVRIPLALFVGIALQIASGLAMLPGVGTLVVSGLAAGTFAVLSRRSGAPTGWRSADLTGGALFSAGVAVTAASVRSGGLMVVSADSFMYLVGARALAAGDLLLSDLDAKRMLALQTLHAPGFALGVEGLQSLGPVMLLASVLLLVLIPTVRATDATPDLVPLGIAAAVALGGAGFAAASSWLRFSAVYVNSHLLVAALVLVLLLLWAVARTHRMPDRVLVVPFGVTVAALVLSRTESLLVVGLLLVGTLAAGPIEPPERPGTAGVAWRAAWWVFGATLLAWNGLLIAAALDSGQRMSLPVAAGLLAGAVALVVPWLLGRSPTLRASLPSGLLALLWTITIAVLVSEVRGAARFTFFTAMRDNLGLGLGGWGLTAPLLIVLGVAGVLRARHVVALAPARMFVLGFIPITLLAKLADGSQGLDVADGSDLFAVLLSGGGRLFWGDSSNRMWTHVALAVLLLAIWPLAGRGDVGGREAGRDANREAARGSSDGRLMAGLRDGAPVMLVGLLGLVVLRMWDPGYLGWDGPATTVSLFEQSVDMIGPDLVDGTTLLATVAVPEEFGLPRDVRAAEVCATVVLINPGPETLGAVTLEVSADGRSGGTDASAQWTDPSDRKTFCVPVGAEVSGDVAVRVLATDGVAGRAMGIMVASTSTVAGDGFLERLEIRYDAPSSDPRGRGVRAVSTLMRLGIREAPAVAFVLLIGSSAAERSSRRRRVDPERTPAH